MTGKDWGVPGLGSHVCNLSMTQADAPSFSSMAPIAQVISARFRLYSPLGCAEVELPA
jgi:hypothetical protein